MVVEHKHKIGYKGAILIEPKPARADQAPVRLRHRHRVYGFLQEATAWTKEVKVNLEQNHALLAGHTF